MAQVEVTGPDEVTEGDTATYTVAIKGFITATCQDDRNGYRDLGNAFSQTAILRLPRVSPLISPRVLGLDSNFRDFRRAVGRMATTPLRTAAQVSSVSRRSKTWTRRTIISRCQFRRDGRRPQWTRMAMAIELDGDQPEGLSIEDDEDQEYNLTTDDDGDAKEGGR